MNVSRPFAMIALTLALAATPLVAQTVMDAKTQKAIQEKESELEKARKVAEAANLALQDDYARMQTMFEMVRSGRDVDAQRDLERVLEEPLKEAVEAGFAGSRGKRALKRNLAKELAKTEHPLLIALRGELSAAVDGAQDSLVAEGNKTPGTADLARATLTQLLPAETPFWKHWNEVLVKSAPSRDNYAEAMKSLRKVEDGLMVLKDPKMRFTIGAPPGMALVEAGPILIESTYGFEAERRKGRVKDFYIDLREVTHGDYWGKFWIHLEDKILKQTYLPQVKEKDREFPAWVQDPETGEYAPLPAMMDLPVTGIDAAAAQAYALSQGKRLPTEAEWVEAATATPGKCSEYPWGEEYKEGLANDAKAGLKALRAVGQSPEGRSYYGLHDMAGNAKEWTFTTVEGRDVDGEIPDGAVLAIRGGSFEGSATAMSVKWRWNSPARNTHENDLGFRCAKDAK